MFTQFHLPKNQIKSNLFYLGSLLSLAMIVANPNPAAAVELKYGSSGNVSKIEGLVVDNITYNVTFKYDSFLNIFGSPNSAGFNTPTFWDNAQGAQAQKAVDNIASLLNDQQPIPGQLNGYNSALVPYRAVIASNGSMFIVNKIDFNGGRNWVNFRGESQDIIIRGNEAANYAIFTVQEATRKVPESNLGTVPVVAFLVGVTTLTRYKNRKS